MLRTPRPLILTVAAAALLLVVSSSAWAVADFDTPGEAAYCGTDHFKGNQLTC